MTKKKGLGRGLGALLEDPNQTKSQPGAPFEVPINSIEPNPYQPRKNPDAKELKALADSILDHGLLEPPVVRLVAPDRYELIAGERRLRAAKLAGLKKIPVVIREAQGVEKLELALLENLQREDLDPIEEAEAFNRLTDEFGRTQEEVARLAGRDRSTVANTMRLLGLPRPVQDDVRHKRLSAGHARALLGLESEDQILAAREIVLSQGLSVRQTEALVKKALKPPRKPTPAEKDTAYFEALSREMARVLGSKVKLHRKGKRGRIEIEFNSNEDLERLMSLLGVKPV